MSNPEIISLTEEDIPALTERIADDLAILGFPGTARRSLEDFLRALHDDQSVSAVALVSVTARIPYPDLDINVLMARTTVDLNPDEEAIERVGRYHDSFAFALRRAKDPEDYYGTFINIFLENPEFSAVEFQQKLVKRFGIGSSAGVIATATLIRS